MSLTVGSVKESLDVVSKAAAIAAAGAYVMGLLVLNLYLSRYHANFLGFFAPQYLTAGLWSLYPIVAGAILWAVYRDTRRRFREARTVGYWLPAAVVALGAVSLPAVAGAPLLVAGVNILSPRVAVLWTAALVESLIPMVLLHYKYARGLISSAALWGLEALLAAAFIIGYSLTFSAAYGSIPARWGGGGENKVVLYPTTEASRSLHALFSVADSMGIPVRLLLLSGDAALVAPRTERTAFLIRRELLAVIALQGEQLPFGEGPGVPKWLRWLTLPELSTDTVEGRRK